jgi:hypothetical protein
MGEIVTESIHAPPAHSVKIVQKDANHPDPGTWACPVPVASLPEKDNQNKRRPLGSGFEVGRPIPVGQMRMGWHTRPQAEANKIRFDGGANVLFHSLPLGRVKCSLLQARP